MKLEHLNEFYIVDTETTGLSPKNADAISVSAVKVRTNENGGFDIIDTFDSYINPLYPLPPEIVAFNKKNHTGINDEMLSKAPMAGDVTLKFHNFLGDNPVLVGHNIDFDIGFINKLYNRVFCGDFVVADKIDTLKLCKDLFPNNRHNLTAMFNLSEKQYSNNFSNGDSQTPLFHTSLADCVATLDVLQMLKDKLYPSKAHKQNVQEEFEMFKPKSLSSETDKEKVSKEKICDDLKKCWDVYSVVPSFFLNHSDVKAITFGVNAIGQLEHNCNDAIFADDDIGGLNISIDKYLKENKSNCQIKITRASNKEEILLESFILNKGKNVISVASKPINISYEYLFGEDNICECPKFVDEFLEKTKNQIDFYAGKRSSKEENERG